MTEITSINSSPMPVAGWMRRIALIISSLTAAFWSFILIDILFCDLVVGCVSVTWDMVLLLFLVVISVASVFISWRWESLGSPVLIFWILLFTAIAYATSHPPHQAFSMMVTGVLFLSAGLLFLASWWSGRIVLNN